jgi:hypothetical protein
MNIHILLKVIARVRKQSKWLLNILAISGLLAISGGSVIGQSALATDEEIGLFMNSTTCLVLEDGYISYNILMKDAVEKYWEITDYEVIDKEEFEERRTDPQYSFLVLIKGSFEDDPAGVQYNYLNLLMGKNAAEVQYMPELASIPLSYSNDQEADYAYAVPAMIQFVQRHVRTLKSRRAHINMLGLTYYNQSRKFKDKSLLLREDHLAPEVGTANAVKEVYPFHFRIVSAEEMLAELEEPEKNTLFLHHVGPQEDGVAGQCFELIFTPDGELYYYSKREVTNDKPDGFTKWDLRRIRF